MNDKNMSNTKSEILLAMSQAKIMLPYMADTVMAYFKELKNAGFADEQAIKLTVNFQQSLIERKE